MVGRFIGAFVLRLVAPGKVLAGFAAAAMLLILISGGTTGLVSGWSLLAVGIFNSIMFPTIFSLASEGLGKRAAEGSGIICMAIVGGAIIPHITGSAADIWKSLRWALAVPALCYALILLYGWFARRPRETGGATADSAV
jgi:FHS family L-fucose permease-like MFS transporter